MENETKKVELYFCEKCEEELPGEKFTIDKNGEYCDDCCEANADRQYDAWKEQEAERQMAEEDKKEDEAMIIVNAYIL